MKKIFAAAVLAAGMMFITGCQSKFNENDMGKIQTKQVKIVIDDKDLAEDLHIYHAGQIKTETGVKGVIFRSRLSRAGFFSWLFKKGEKYELEYRLVWYTADGKEAPAKGGYPWRKVILRDGQEFSISFFAPAPGIENATLFFRPAAAPVAAPKDAKAEKKDAKAVKKDAKAEKKDAPAPRQAEPKKAEPAAKQDSAKAATLNSSISASGSGDTLSAAQLQQQVKNLRADISKQIKTDGDEPGVSISEKEAIRSGEQVMSSNVAGKDRQSVSSTAENIAKPAAQLQKEEKQKADNTCICGCDGKLDSPCYCSANSNCPAAKAKAQKQKTETAK